MRTAFAALAVAAALAASAFAGDEKRRPPAKDGFEAIQAVLRGTDAAQVEAVLPGKLVDPGTKDPEVKAWRDGMARRLARAAVLGAREGGDEGVVRLAGEKAGDEAEVAICWAGTRWVVASPATYQLKGAFVDAARGGSAARCTLVARTEVPRGYGKSAFSFTHVTGAPREFKNRADVWFDGVCGCLHTSGDARITSAGDRVLEKVEGIPVGAKWENQVEPAKGATFVVHCRRPGREDWYASCRVLSVVGNRLDLEWTVLAAGLGTPTSIHKALPDRSPDEGDGYDGICGRPAGPGRPAGRGGDGGAAGDYGDDK